MCQNSREQTSSIHFPWDCYRRSNKQNFTWMCYQLANTLTNSSIWTHPLLFGMASSPSSYPSLPSLTLSLMRSLPLSASLFSPSAFLKVFSMFYLCDNHTCFCHSAQCNTGRRREPILSRSVFQHGRHILQSLCLARGSRCRKTHYTNLEYYFSPLLSVPVRLVVIGCGGRRFTGAVWGNTSHWKWTRQPS